jgi:hypothetical protein
MAKILTFPERQLNSASEAHVNAMPDFLVFDSDGTLSFSQTTSVDSDQSAVQPDIPRDWTNQELASIYRVKHLLDAAQIPTELDRGLSDEGEPWCVFCTLEADVFIHLSRIDGLYWLDSPKLPAPLNGLSFDELVQGFINLSEAGQKLSEDSRKIVRFQKNNSVFLHPSVMLAALVWSLYFDSDELLIPSSQADDNHAPDQNSFNPWALLGDNLEHDGLKNTSSEDDAKIWASEALGQDEFKTSTVSSANFPFSVTLGLGSIAVASGLILESEWRDIVLSLLLRGEGAGHSSGSSSNADVPNALVSMLLQSMDVLASFVAQADDEQVPDTDDAALISAEADFRVDEILAKLVELANFLEGARSVSEDVVQQDVSFDLDLPVESLKEYAVLEGMENLLTESELGQAFADETSQSDVVVGLMDFFFGGSSLTTISMDGVTYLIDFSFDDLSIEGMDLVEQVILDTETNENLVLSATQDQGEAEWDASDALPLFDEIAQQFVFGLLEQSDSIQMVLVQKDLVFFDVAAYQSGEERVQMSWDTGDGGTVSLLGAKADFMEFGFV